MISKSMFSNIKGIFHVDKFLLIVVLSIVLFGILMVYDASVFYADQNFGLKYRFLILQGCWITIGLIGAAVLSTINLDFIKRNSGFIFIAALVFLTLVLLPTSFAPEIYGARRWFYFNPSPLPRLPIIGVIGFQPSEFAKLAGIIFGAAFFSTAKFKNESSSTTARNYLFLIFIVAALIAVEPDFTTAFITFMILLSIAYFAYAPIKTMLLYLTPVGIAGTLYAMSSSYRLDRIKTLFVPHEIDKLGAGYHIRQIMIALGSGGFWGLGFGNSRQKYAYLPEVIGDSIFAVVGEEFGYLGSVFLITLFILLIGRCFYIAEHAKDRFETLLVKGVTVWITMQALINLSAMVRIMPLTGVPLPLVSYGGSSTLFMLLGLGLVFNVSKGISTRK